MTLISAKSLTTAAKTETPLSLLFADVVNTGLVSLYVHCAVSQHSFSCLIPTPSSLPFSVLSPTPSSRCPFEGIGSRLPNLLHLIEMYKLLNGRERISSEQFFSLAPTEHSTRGDSLKLFKERCRLNCRKYSFSQRAVDDWNSLPSKVIDATSVNAL